VERKKGKELVSKARRRVIKEEQNLPMLYLNQSILVKEGKKGTHLGKERKIEKSQKKINKQIVMHPMESHGGGGGEGKCIGREKS